MSSHTKELVEKILNGLNTTPKGADVDDARETTAEGAEETVDSAESCDGATCDTADDEDATAERDTADDEDATAESDTAEDGDDDTLADDEAGDLLSNLEELRREYPDLPLEELASNELFIRFARGKGNDFRTICADFDNFIDSVRQSILEEEKEKRKMQRRTGGGSRTNASTYGLSRSQLDFLEEWNRENPDYAMTPKQYANSLRND